MLLLNTPILNRNSSGKHAGFAAMALLALFFFTPKPVTAKTLQFQDKTWEVAARTEGTATLLPIRNDFQLTSVTKNSVLGTSLATTQQLFDSTTADKINTIAQEINQPAQDAKLVIEGKFAKEFNPGQNGQGLDVYALRKLLAMNDATVSLPVVYSVPVNKLADTNNIGIKELVATGESDFTGSPKNRIHNITVGAAKFNGLIIDKGEEFSFNTYLGDVDDKNGFLPELVIKKTGLVPEFGGGLCQVSSTAFRGAMNAGFPITARRNHSFAVQYYAPQGTDATIYPGSQDLKFINNLNSPVVVHTRIVGTKLYFEYYGTKDNRVVTFEGPTQYDKKPDGSMKATWSRQVTLNGENSKQTFNSVYQPPALFQKEEQSATPNPQAVPTPPTPPVTTTIN